MHKYRLYIYIVVLVHTSWALLVLGGTFFMFFNHAYALAQIEVMSFTLLLSLAFRNNCPLTLIEEHARKKIDPSYVPSRSFSTTYINKIFGTRFSPQEVHRSTAFLYIFSYVAATIFLIYR